MKTVNLVGCGAVGRTLGRLWHREHLFEIQDVLARSPESARRGTDFIGAGRPVASLAEMRRADLFMLAVADDALADCARRLADAGLVGQGTVVCHLSGALPSSVLAPVAQAGGLVASVHPVHSFADPARSVAEFAGTWCGSEGDPEALELLVPAFAALGGRLFPVDPAFKTLYHTGAVLVCNYLTALLEAGVRAYGKGGVPRDTAFQVMEPLVRGTVDNIFRAGTAQALTGPIARGDAATVERQLAALDGWDAAIARVYRSLGEIALDLARQRGGAAPEALRRVGELLEPS